MSESSRAVKIDDDLRGRDTSIYFHKLNYYDYENKLFCLTYDWFLDP